MTVRLNFALIHARAAELRLSGDDFAERTGTALARLVPGLDPAMVSVATLGRIGDALRMHPGDLISPEHVGNPLLDPEDPTLVEAVLSHLTAIRPTDLAALLAWPADRLHDALQELEKLLARDGIRTLVTDEHDRLSITGRDKRDQPVAGKKFHAWLGGRISPDPWEACAIMSIIHAHLLAPAAGHGAYTARASADALADRRLAHIPKRPSTGRNSMVPFNLDTPIEPHPDLLFALGLAAAPEPEPTDGRGTASPPGAKP